MKLYRTKQGIVIEFESNFYLSPQKDWDTYVNRDDLFDAVSVEIQTLSADASLEEILKTYLLAPINQQEIWASGVTYMKSREARMEESKDAGGGDNRFRRTHPGDQRFLQKSSEKKLFKNWGADHNHKNHNNCT